MFDVSTHNVLIYLAVPNLIPAVKSLQITWRYRKMIESNGNAKKSNCNTPFPRRKYYFSGGHDFQTVTPFINSSKSTRKRYFPWTEDFFFRSSFCSASNNETMQCYRFRISKRVQPTCHVISHRTSTDFSDNNRLNSLEKRYSPVNPRYPQKPDSKVSMISCW